MQGSDMYLGLPIDWRTQKRQMGTQVIQRVTGRIQGWMSKRLSPAGKEILIKSTAAAIPTYIMSCFKLPISVTNKLESIKRQFWWKNSKDKAAIHWIAWDKLTQPKRQGGLGFRRTHDYNLALLMKQAWRVFLRQMTHTGRDACGLNTSATHLSLSADHPRVNPRYGEQSYHFDLFFCRVRDGT